MHHHQYQARQGRDSSLEHCKEWWRLFGQGNGVLTASRAVDRKCCITSSPLRCSSSTASLQFHSYHTVNMRSSRCVALFAGAAIAQESATILNFFQFDSTLTVLGSDASATTYQNSCPSDGAGISAVPSDMRMLRNIVERLC